MDTLERGEEIEMRDVVVKGKDRHDGVPARIAWRSLTAQREADAAAQREADAAVQRTKSVGLWSLPDELLRLVISKQPGFGPTATTRAATTWGPSRRRT